MATTKTTAAKAPVAKTTAARPAAAKTETVKASPKLDVTVKLYGVKAEELFLVGNIAAFGSWDASKAKKMTKKGDVFTASVAVQKGELIEFKVAAAACWCKVEKGLFGEELENHHVFIDNDVNKIEIGVSNFSEN